MAVSLAPIRLGIQRHTGPLARMGRGLWMSDPAQHKPGRRILVWFCCPDCGAVADIDPEDVGPTGDVAGEFICQEVRCDFVRLIQLSSWALPVFSDAFDTSDVKP